MAITGQKAEWSNPGLSFSRPDTLIWHESLCLSYTHRDTHRWMILKVHSIHTHTHKHTLSARCAAWLQLTERWELTLVKCLLAELKHKHTPQPLMGLNRHPCGHIFEMTFSYEAQTSCFLHVAACKWEDELVFHQIDRWSESAHGCGLRRWSQREGASFVCFLDHQIRYFGQFHANCWHQKTFINDIFSRKAQ